MRDELDVLPLGPRPARPDPFVPHPKYTIRDGRLRGPGVLYAPTSVKFYRRPPVLEGRPVAIVEHYTAVRAPVRPLKDLGKLLMRAEERLDNTTGAIDELELELLKLGCIPDAVSLTLQNAGKKRGASWCFVIGAEPLEDGTIPICQYNPHLEQFGTWHAGSPPTWKMRKRYRNRTFRTSRGEIRWDGRNYRWPEVELPNGDRTVLGNVNPYVLGIEYMNLGKMTLKKRLRYPNVPTVKIDGKLYEQPSRAQLAARSALLACLAEAFGDPPRWGHRDLVPWGKVDPTPPY